MGVTSRIKDGSGSGHTARVSRDQSLHVITHPYPPSGFDEINTLLPFSDFLRDNNGSNNMVVNGSLNSPIEFRFGASNSSDIYINKITIQITDRNMNLNLFGGISALTNGVSINYLSGKIGEEIISKDLKTNLDFFREASGGKGFGDGVLAWKADVSGSGDETYFPEINFSQMYGIPYGLKINKNSNDKLFVLIKDNLAGVSIFNIKVHGSKLFDF